MEGFIQPKVGNFIPDHISTYPWGKRGRIETWRCVICNTPGIRDRIVHNVGNGCAPVGWLDPLGVLVETVFALWGPGAPDVVKAQLPLIPEGKSVKVSELPYFTKHPTDGTWLVIGLAEFMAPESNVMVNRRGEDPQEVIIDTWLFERTSLKTGNKYVMASFRRVWEVYPTRRSNTC